MVPLIQRDRRSYYTSTPDVYGSCKSICPSGVLTPPGFAFYRELFVNGTKTKKGVVGRITKVKM